MRTGQPGTLDVVLGLRIGVVVALLAGASCGRVGYDASDGESGPGGIVSDAGGVVDAALTSDDAGESPRDGGPPHCEIESGMDCATTTTTVNIGGTLTIGSVVKVHPVPINPQCEPGEVAEMRMRLLAPATPALADLTIDAPFDVVVTVLKTDCDGTVDTCMSIAQGSATTVQIIMIPGEEYVVSVGSILSCGFIEVVVRASALGSG